MAELLNTEAVTAFLQVIIIDLVLAGDNAIVIGLAAAGLPREQRTKAILVGIVAATALRIGFAGITTQLLKLVGLLFAGGLLLLWVSWKMWRELRTPVEEGREAAEPLTGYDINANGMIAARIPRKTFAQAAGQIIVADVSMSLAVRNRRQSVGNRHCPPAAESPLDCLYRLSRDPLRRTRDDLSRIARIAACRQSDRGSPIARSAAMSRSDLESNRREDRSGSWLCENSYIAEMWKIQFSNTGSSRMCAT